MQIIWLGHSGFRIEIEDQVLLVDPWLGGNPTFPDDKRSEAIADASAILLTHGHFDHAADIEGIVKDTGAHLYAMVELAGILEHRGFQTTGFNFGGTVAIGATTVTMVRAAHSSTIELDGRLLPAGDPAGFILRGEGHTIYISGDTDVMADMGVIAERYAPDIGILCCGGHFTMDMAGAAFAAKKYFNFKTVIPCHYKTFPLLAQSAQPLVDALPDIDVIEPQVLAPIEI